MMDDLIHAVARAANLPQDQAALAVAAMMRFFTTRLPSALVGELHARLRGPASGQGSPGAEQSGR